MTISGGLAMPRGGPDIFRVPSPTFTMSIVLMIILTLALLGFLVTTVTRQAAPNLEADMLRGLKDDLLTRIAKLDDLYATGTVSEQIYKLERTELTNTLAQVYYRLKFEKVGQKPKAKSGKKGVARV